MLSTLYRVDITQLTGSSNGDGFIDANTIEFYMTQGSNPSTVADSLSKERANIRYKQVIYSLQLMANMYVPSYVATGGSSTAAPTTFSFTLQCERGDDYIYTPDENNAGVILTGAAAIKRAIARACLETRTTLTTYYDPTLTTVAGNGTQTAQAARYGQTALPVTAGALATTISAAEAAITVTRDSNT